MAEVAGDDDEEEDDDETVTPRLDVVRVSRESAARVAANLDVPLIQRSRGTFSSADDSVRLVCAYSRTYGAAPEGGFWFAFHPYQNEFLEEAKRGFVTFAATVLLIPLAEFKRWLPGMHETISPDRRYWHMRIERKNGRFTMNRRKGHERIDLTKYLV